MPSTRMHGENLVGPFVTVFQMAGSRTLHGRNGVAMSMSFVASCLMFFLIKVLVERFDIT